MAVSEEKRVLALRERVLALRDRAVRGDFLWWEGEDREDSRELQGDFWSERESIHLA